MTKLAYVACLFVAAFIYMSGYMMGSRDVHNYELKLAKVEHQLADVNAQVEANKALAKEREDMADKAAQEADIARKALTLKERERAARDREAELLPDCKSVLELKLCPELLEY